MIGYYSPSYLTLILAQSLSAAQHLAKLCSQMMAIAACTTGCTYIKLLMDLIQRKSLGMIHVVKTILKLKNFKTISIQFIAIECINNSFICKNVFKIVALKLSQMEGVIPARSKQVISGARAAISQGLLSVRSVV